MKIRIRFAKRGNMKFIGHLDIMRYFQKAIRRAGIDVAMTEGFSPHQIMSFAAPLGVGLCSEGEYLDIEVKSTGSSKEMVEVLNSVMVEGMEIVSFRQVPEESKKAMASVAGADYFVEFRDESIYGKIHDHIEAFMAKDSIVVLKKTKKSEKEVDIKPMIYAINAYENYIFNNKGHKGVFLQIATGSVNNLKPELVIKALCEFTDVKLSEFGLLVTRLNVYGNEGDDNNIMLTSLEDLASEIE